jgi:hypothetical protein
MALLTSLEDMIRAIAGSVMNAQHMVEKAQLANIASFFDDDHRPTMLDVELPAIHSTAQPDATRLYQVPVLALVPHGSLVIGEAEIDLDLELGAFEHHDRDNAHATLIEQMGRAAPADKKAGLMINPSAGGLAGKNGTAVHVKLKLVAAEKSEGLARLLNDVVTTQGAVAVRRADTASPRPSAPSPPPQDAGADAVRAPDIAPDAAPAPSLTNAPPAIDPTAAQE